MQRPDWYLDELAHAGHEHLDAAYVATYDRKAAVDPAPDIASLQTLGLSRGSVVVDLGAGTGTFALAVAPHCGRVVAVDVSETMLAALEAKAEHLGLENVEMVHAGFLTYEHQGAPADIVYSRNALHHLPDFWKALALSRIAAMLRPGGVFFLRDLIYCFDPSEASDTIEAWLASRPERPEDGWTRAEIAEHVRGEYSTFNWLLEAMLERAGFAIRDVSATGTYAAYTCVKR